MSSEEGAPAPYPRTGKTFLADDPVPYTRMWVMMLPLREQGTLLAGIRGCDTVVDLFVPNTIIRDGQPQEQIGWTQYRHPTKAIVAALRYVVGTPVDMREVDAPGAFMASQLPDVTTWPVKCLDDLPLHFVMHFMHAIEVVAYRLPTDGWYAGQEWLRLYYRICDHMHVESESREAFIARMAEDRIALGTVVPVSRVEQLAQALERHGPAGSF